MYWHAHTCTFARAQATLLFGNLTADDILLRGELESLVQQHPDRLKVGVGSSPRAPRSCPIPTPCRPALLRSARTCAPPPAAPHPPCRAPTARPHARALPPQVVHVLNTPPKGWSGGSGFITADLIRAHLPPPGPGTLVLRCGPLPMCEAMKQHLDALGYAEDAQFQF